MKGKRDEAAYEPARGERKPWSQMVPAPTSIAMLLLAVALLACQDGSKLDEFIAGVDVGTVRRLCDSGKSCPLVASQCFYWFLWRCVVECANRLR